MKPDERDAAYLWDMLDASRRIERLITGLDYAAPILIPQLEALIGRADGGRGLTTKPD